MELAFGPVCASGSDAMRGFYGIGVEGISKAGNLGNLFRSAHAFGASFAFTVAPDPRAGFHSDTSSSYKNMPFYNFDSVEDMRLPRACKLVGIELTEDAVDLPSFHHPHSAAYVLGPERGSLSGAMLARCDHVVRIPTAFCINVAIAGAVVMYDRLRTKGRFARRPESAAGAAQPLPDHVHGAPVSRKRPPRRDR
jgi:tRNA G18 (ribose-2'-O)-methylase SpoU